MKSRKTVDLSERFNKRWMGYAVAAGAAGVGMLTVAQPAKADIIYTPGGPVGNCFMYYTQTICDYSLSVANNGINNFLFSATQTFRGGFVYGGHVVVNAYPGNGMEVGPLDKGAVIGHGDPFGNYAILALGFKAYGTPGTYTGPWWNVSNRFLGLDVTIDGQTYFGWAELSIPVSHHTPSLDIEGYAYNNVAGQPIEAGQTTSTPEPGTLGLLALGSLGLGFWRRRKAVGSQQQAVGSET